MAGVLIWLKLLDQLLGCAAQTTNLLLAPSAEARLGLRYRKGGVGRVGPRSTVSPGGKSKDLVVERGTDVLEAITEDDAQLGRRRVKLVCDGTRDEILLHDACA